MIPHPPETSQLRGHVIVVGLHGIGLRVVEQLLGIGQQVVVIDDGADDRSVRQIALWEVGHVVGNAARVEVLEMAGLATARAVICTERNELHTLEVALLARELNEGVRVIVRSSNAPVGEAIAGVTGVGTVLSAEELSAPAFTEAVLQQRIHDFRLSGELFRIIEVEAKQAGSLRESYGDLAPIVAASAEGVVAVFPSRDETVAAGDRVALLATPEQFRKAGLISSGDAAKSQIPVGARYGKQAPPKSSTGSLRSLWQSVFYGADRALKTTIILFLSLIVVATIVIDIWYVNRSSDDAQMDVIDALYTTVQTLVTVGYGDFPFGDQPTALRIFDILLMLVGAALVAILFAQLTDLLVSRRIAATFGSQRAGTMRNHYIVVGLGGVGIRVVEQLRAAGKRVAVIDKEPSPRNVSRARALSVPVVVADATDSDALAAANLSAAAGVAVLTSSDLANIETGLAIRGELGDRRDSVTTVLRLFDRHLSATVQKAFGFREVRSTAALAAPWFVAASLGLKVTTSLTLSGRTLMIGRLTVSSRGKLAGIPLHELGVGIRVVAIKRAGASELEHPPRRDTVLTAGDRAYVIGPHGAVLDALVRNIASTDEPDDSDD